MAVSTAGSAMTIPQLAALLQSAKEQLSTMNFPKIKFPQFKMPDRLTLSIVALIVIGFSVLVAIAGCSKHDVSFETVEQARKQARDNAMWNAQSYRQSNVLYQQFDIIGRGDSSQTNDCPQGDGWATMDFVPPSKDPKGVVQVKCSTVSESIGCLESKDFKTKAYAADDGHCQATSKVPFPLPKIGK